MADTKKKKTAAKKVDAPVLKKAKEEDKELQKKLKDFIGASLPEMMESFKEMTPTKKWELIIQLLPYATPKMQATSIDGSMDYDPLSTQLGQLANSISSKE